MELRQLGYFVAVAEELSFTRAAARLRVAQPAVSQQVRRLERQVRQQLVDRSDRRVRLTPAGEVFIAHAKAALAAAQAGIDEMHSFAGDLSGVFTIGTVPAPPAWLFDCLSRFRSRHPAVRARLVTGDPEQLADAVAIQSVDLALIGVTGPRQPAGPRGSQVGQLLASWPVEREPLVVVVPAGHDLAGRNRVTIRQLAATRLVTLVAGSGLRSVLESVFATVDVSPHVVAEVDDLHQLAPLVRAGIGAAVVPSSVAQANPDLHAIQLIRPALERATALLWHRRASTRIARAFLTDNGIVDTDTAGPAALDS